MKSVLKQTTDSFSKAMVNKLEKDIIKSYDRINEFELCIKKEKYLIYRLEEQIKEFKEEN